MNASSLSLDTREGSAPGVLTPHGPGSIGEMKTLKARRLEGYDRLYSHVTRKSVQKGLRIVLPPDLRSEFSKSAEETSTANNPASG